MLEECNDNWTTGRLEYPFGRGINFQISVKSIAPLVKSLKRNHYLLKVDLEENWYRKGKVLLGEREFLVMDPDGYLLRFSQNIGTRRRR